MIEGSIASNRSLQINEEASYIY